MSLTFINGNRRVSGFWLSNGAGLDGIDGKAQQKEMTEWYTAVVNPFVFFSSFLVPGESLTVERDLFWFRFAFILRQRGRRGFMFSFLRFPTVGLCVNKDYVNSNLNRRGLFLVSSRSVR